MNGTNAVARILQQEGVEYLFSYPANPIIEAAAALGIRPIVARSEKTLINMVDGFSRATNGRRTAVCAVQAGAGIENAYGGIAQAFADSIPMLILPGGPDQSRQGVPGEYDPLPTYRNVTKWASRVNMAGRIPEMLRRAFTQLRTGQSGPVLLEIPGDVMRAEVGEATFAYKPARGYRSGGDPEDVAEAVRLLLGASRPVLFVGHGVLWAEATEELRALAELVQVPVVTTMTGKSAFPEDHPLSAGTGGLTLARAAAQVLTHADLIFGLGCSFAKGNFSTPLPPGKTLIQVTHAERDIDNDYTTDLAIVGDAKLVLRQLLAEVERQGGAGARSGYLDVADEIRTVRAVEHEEWRPRLTSDETPISPYRVIGELMHAVDPRQTIVTHDAGNPRDQLLTVYEALVPRGYLGWGRSTQLGTGLGLALGAKLALPEKLVINVMGDLAFGTAGMEVETAVRERLPILTIVLNNSRMGGYSNYMPIASERYGTNALSGRYAGVAAELGAYSERVDQPGEVAAAIRRAIAATQEGRPALLEMITREAPIYAASHLVYEQVGLLAGRSYH
jgi:acetolactate synthase I/II/III large subunit